MKDSSTKTMKKGEKLFFALADLYGGGGQALIGVIYPLFFLIEIIGLSPTLAGLIVLISEFWDAISDPLMGVLCDNTRTRIGRRRPYIFVGGVLLIAAFALTFLPVGFEGEMKKFLYCTVTYLFYNTVSTMINVSYSSLSAEISTVSSERDRANVLRLVVSTVGTAACTIIPTVFTGMYDKGTISVTTLYLIIGVGFGIFFALPVILCAVFVKERVEMPKEKARFDIREFVAPLKIRTFRQLLGMYIGQAICMEVFSAGIIMFAKYVTNFSVFLLRSSFAPSRLSTSLSRRLTLILFTALVFPFLSLLCWCSVCSARICTLRTHRYSLLRSDLQGHSLQAGSCSPMPLTRVSLSAESV